VVGSLQPLTDNLLVSDVRERVEQSRFFLNLLRAGMVCNFPHNCLSSSLHNRILDAILHHFLSCHCDGPLHNPLILRNRLPTHGLDLFGSFVNGRRSLVLGDVERSYDFLLAFRRFGEFFFVLERLLELIR
jgi:hypothetical protein